MSPTVIVIAA